jgi:cell division protein FtsQ
MPGRDAWSEPGAGGASSPRADGTGRSGRGPLRPEAEGEEPRGAEAEGEGLEVEYRRRAKPVRVRRRRAADWLKAARKGWRPAAIGLAALACLIGLDALLFHSPWFVLTGSDQIAVVGAQHTSPRQVQAVFAADYGRDVFFIPLAERQAAIEAIPWVQRATVMRVWPARLQVEIEERQPVGFARAGRRLKLVDAHGVVLPEPASGNYDFPVIDGLAGAGAAEANAATWVAQRATQMQQFAAVMAGVRKDGGAGWKVSEVDLGEPDDARVRVSPAAGGKSVLVHLGNEHYAARYAIFLAQVGGWQRTYPYLAGVDLRYDGQAIVDPGAPPATGAGRGGKAQARKPAGGGRRG